MKKWLPVLFLGCGMIAEAEVTLPSVFGDNMVLQQRENVLLWGKADGKKVKITTGWNKKTYEVKPDANGQWRIHIPTPGASGPYEIRFDDGKEKLLKNVLLGEVWLCSGQSNMEMPMKGFKNQPVAGANLDIVRSKNPEIRLLTVKRTSTIDPQPDIQGNWQEAAPVSVREFSATAYYFGRLLNETLDVPVGLIVSAWGGSCVEAWMTPQMLAPFKEVRIPQKPEDIKEKNRTPTTLYQGMIHPLAGYTIKGAIWYQGESNYDRAHSYAAMFTTMVNGWREKWGQGNFPFYYCQIAPYDYRIITPAGKEVINSAYLREAQLQAEKMIPNSGMAVLMDAGLKEGIHPAKKQVAGERLSLLALKNTYGLEGFGADSPVFKEMTLQNDTAVIAFENAPMWITAKGNESDCFQVAGKDRRFYPAKAWIVRSKVYVKAEEVKEPVAVRYAFENYVEGDLYSTEGLPVSSFRTDNWD
ncbi:MAG: sialate O-acetylesterase [Bacteroidales bacterium]